MKKTRQATLGEFNPQWRKSDSESGDESHDSANQPKCKTILQWTRVRSQMQLHVAHPRIFDVASDLRAAEEAVGTIPASFYREQPFVFNPGSFEDVRGPPTPENVKLT